jgi:hypothetical protein
MITMNRASTKPKRFKLWRSKRPFTGGLLCMLSGIIILAVPVQLYEVAATPGSMIVVGLLLGGLTFLMGLLSFIMPKLSTLLGIIAILAASLSIMGALGGFIIGTLFGLIGGAFCIAWKPELSMIDIQSDSKTIKEVASGIENTTIN